MNINHLITKTVSLDKGKPALKRAEIRNYFLKTWEIDELLYTQLKSDEIFYHRGDSLRHILLFYLGHTAVFYINKFMLTGLISKRINPSFESIFAIGVDEMSWDDLDEKHYIWPQVSLVRKYREEAKELILNVIDTAPLNLPVKWMDPFWIIMMGIEHERIHLETSSVLIRQLPLEEVVGCRFGNICQERGNPNDNKLVSVPGKKIILGKPEAHHLYGWDNEYGSYTEEVKAFMASQSLISNQEFLAFIEDGGYGQESYWTEEGWNWCQFKQAEMPLFWRKKTDGYWLRLVAEEIQMPWNWPAEVNYLEAKAFCNWKSAKTGKNFRLPTEAEWYRLYELCNLPDQPDWKEAPGNINLEHYASPCPVNLFKQGDFYDVTGNVWQWTETPITGFPGFKVHPMYDDFSTPTFDGKHNIIKGGSWISTGNEATKHARYAFRRHFYQHAGFRIVQSDEQLLINNETYETDVDVANSCENMWGNSAPSNFHVQLALEVRKRVKLLASMNVLDMNADTGRLSFELAPYVQSITAIDFSARFIQMPIRLQERGFMRYIVKDENELVFYRELVLADTGLNEDVGKIKFMQDNANNIKPVYTGYDLIIAPCILEELSNPKQFLADIHTRLKTDGWLVIASDYDWEENHIKPECRPGGFKQDGEPVTSLEGIREILAPHFNQEGTAFNLFKYEWQSSRQTIQRLCEVTVWKMK
jgi:5-histidylcysteine sulfoxide synthase/putative 4-mercaptohistidine N1-methyltranferase